MKLIIIITILITGCASRPAKRSQMDGVSQLVTMTGYQTKAALREARKATNGGKENKSNAFATWGMMSTELICKAKFIPFCSVHFMLDNNYRSALDVNHEFRKHCLGREKD